MTLLWVWIIVCGGVCAMDRPLRQFMPALAAFHLLAALFLMPAGDAPAALVRATLVAAMITAVSAMKYHHSGMKLTVSDLALVRAGTLRFLVQQYRRTAIAALALAALFAILMLTPVAFDASPALPLPLRTGFLIAAAMLCVLLYRSGARSAYFKSSVSEPAHYFSSFIASVFDVASWRRTGGLQFVDIAPQGIGLDAPAAAQSPNQPDIIVIQHESVFDPRLFGLPIEPWLQRFLGPPTGLYGRLHVEIFGGGSWQTEFSLLTGLASRSFGPDAYFLFQRGVGRFHHSLPLLLKGLGYRTMLAAGCERSFVNYDAFYGSIGVDERWFTEDFPPPFDKAQFDATNSDGLLLDAALTGFESSIARDPAPRFMMLLTNYNHGPHNRRTVPAGRYETERAFAFKSLPDTQYAEYYARLADTAACWQRLKAELAARFPNRPMLIVRYGDHHPVMTRRIEAALGLADDTQRQFETFYAIEGINMQPLPVALEPNRALDIAFLGTVALQAAGLPLDAVSATRAGLIDECGADYFASPSLRKRGFHRTLVDQEFVDCGAGASAHKKSRPTV